MWLEEFEKEDSVVIFNHVPKVGGTSLIRFFEEIYGKDKCFRHRARNSKDDSYSKSVQALSQLEIAQLNLIAGQFEYGNHKLVSDRNVKYIGVVRDPMDRIVSDYFFNKKHGRADRKAMTNELSLEEYILKKASNPKSKLVASYQIQYLTGQSDIDRAKEIVDSQYLVACNTLQLNKCQQLLCKYFERPDLTPVFTNKSSKKVDLDLSNETIELVNDKCSLDREFISYVEAKFEKLHLDFGSKS